MHFNKLFSFLFNLYIMLRIEVPHSFSLIHLYMCECVCVCFYFLTVMFAVHKTKNYTNSRICLMLYIVWYFYPSIFHFIFTLYLYECSYLPFFSFTFFFFFLSISLPTLSHSVALVYFVILIIFEPSHFTRLFIRFYRVLFRIRPYVILILWLWLWLFTLVHII